MKIMANDSSATAREHTPHANGTTRTSTIIDALKRRAQAVLNDKSIDAESRAILRYALETNDPWLAELVRRAEAGEDIVNSLQTIENSEADELLRT
jgi:plasmid stability protein